MIHVNAVLVYVAARQCRAGVHDAIRPFSFGVLDFLMTIKNRPRLELSLIL